MCDALKQAAINTLKLTHLVYIKAKRQCLSFDSQLDFSMRSMMLVDLMFLNQFEDTLSMLIRRITLTDATDTWLSQLSESLPSYQLRNLRFKLEYIHGGTSKENPRGFWGTVKFMNCVIKFALLNDFR
jgi:hypothetical protein